MKNLSLLVCVFSRQTRLVALLCCLLCISVVSHADGDRGPLYAVKIDSLCWSPDGKQLVFSTNRDSKSLATQDGGLYLWVVNDDGSKLHQITFADEKQGETIHFEDRNPNWSPDGGTIVFDSNRGESDARNSRSRQIFKCSPDGKDIVQISKSRKRFSNENPSFDPSGRFLAWTTSRNSGEDIIISYSTGEELGYIAFDRTRFEDDLSWGEGNKVAFISHSSPIEDNMEISVVVADVSLPEEDFQEKGSVITPPLLPSGKQDLIFSIKDWHGLTGAIAPQGSLIAYIAQRNPKSGLWVRDLKSGKSKRLCPALALAAPAWSRDANRIAFVNTSERVEGNIDYYEEGIYFYNISKESKIEVPLTPIVWPEIKK